MEITLIVLPIETAVKNVLSLIDRFYRPEILVGTIPEFGCTPAEVGQAFRARNEHQSDISCPHASVVTNHDLDR
jgi:hypothetical protein